MTILTMTMTPHYQLAVTLTITILVFQWSPAHLFPVHPSSTSLPALDSDWDNSDFLSRLSGSPHERDAATDQPHLPYPPQTPAASSRVGPKASPRPVGFNPDAYAVSNTADVYFAQLKQDSKVRKAAWLAGDVDRANQVFSHDSVRKIADSWVDNPYTRERNLEEAKAQIQGAVRMQMENRDLPRDWQGRSYKKKLQERMQQRGAKLTTTMQARTTGQTGQDMTNRNVLVTKPTSVPGEGLSSPSTVPLVSMVTPPINQEDVTRGKIRTLQGLLLKHRGGPGFGAGRLKAPEASRLQQVLQEVTTILRSETEDGSRDYGSRDTLTSNRDTLTSNRDTLTSNRDILTSNRDVLTSNRDTQTGNRVFREKVNPSVVATPSVPIVRSSTAQPASSFQAIPSHDPIAGTVACVEAVLKVYKDATPAEREALILPLREAFMAAANASNNIIESKHLPNAVLEEKDDFVTQASPIMSFPTSYHQTNPEIVSTRGQEESWQRQENRFTSIDTDENTKTLEDAYKALQNASGKGKYGLRNLSGDEAKELAEKLEAMRGVLLEELGG